MANKPNNPSLWSKAKSLAKQKFDVYPSAYANGWAAKWYKSKGGTWRKAEYGMEVPYMADGGEKMPPEIARARFAAAGNLDKLDEYGYAYGGYIPEMAAGGWAQQAAIAVAMKKAGKKPKNDGLPKAPFGMFLLPGIMNRANSAMDTIKSNPQLLNLIAPGAGSMAGMMQDGGEPDGEMALGQIAAVVDKMDKLRQFIQPDSDLEPWVSSKLAVMDHYADAVSDYMTYGAEGDEEESEEMEMEEMKMGGIPQRYKNMGFNKVGVKKNSTRPGKKWMVLAKKGDQYKVVHGGYDGMKDFSQHGSEKRKENFWNRMGGKNSSKATDPFSPLYWHKRFGTWEEGGEIGMPEMKGGGSTWSGNAWYANGGNTINNTNMFTYPFLPIAQGGFEAPPRQEDYPDYGSFNAAMDNWISTVGNQYYGSEQPIEQDTPGGIPMPLPIELQQAAVPVAPPAIDYSGISIVDLLGSVNKASDFNSRIALAEKMNIKDYRGTSSQNLQMIKKILNDPTILNDYNPPKASKNKASVSSSTANDQGITQPSDSTQSNKKPVTATTQKKQESDSPTNAGVWAGIGLMGALAAAGLTAIDVISTDFEKLASSNIFKGIDKRKLTLARKKLIDEAFKAGATSIEQAQKFYSKLPARAKKIMDNLDAMEIPNYTANMAKGSAARNVQAYNALQESAAEDAIMAAREASAARQATAPVGRSFIDATKAFGRNVGTGSVRNAKNAWNTIREAYGVARATPFFKLLRREDGGYVPMMQVGGDPDSTFENVIEFLDPTGISAWDDVSRTFDDPYAPWWEKSLAVLSAVPIVGKFGKGAKAASELSKLRKVANTAEKVITPVAQMDKYVNPASRFVSTVTGRAVQNAPKPFRVAADIGSKANQTRRFFTGTDLLFGYENGGIYINPANEGKFTAKAKAAGMGVQAYANKVLSAPEGKYPASTRKQANFARNASKWKKQEGGLVEGDVLDVTPEELQMLKAGGYTFEIID
jgi:peptidoglycan L-alanyl-D-glutamate endopeptidase CwlK